MREVQATEAKARLAELLRQVEAGETIAITRHGQTVAHLIPVQTEARDRRQKAMDRFMQARSRWKPTGMSRDEILAARHAGHRV